MIMNYLLFLLIAVIVAEIIIKSINNVEKLSTEDKVTYIDGNKKTEKYTKKDWVIPVVGLALYIIVIIVSIGLIVLSSRMEVTKTSNLNTMTPASIVYDIQGKLWRTIITTTQIYIFVYFAVRIILYLFTRNKVKHDNELTDKEKELVLKYKYSNWMKYVLYCLLAQIVPVIINFLTQVSGPGGLY